MAKNEEVKITEEEAEERNDEWVEEAESKTVKTKDFKDIVIETCKGIIADYKELMKNSNDTKLLEGFEDESKNEDECVNYIMNNLTKQRIYGGRDSLMYPYIHDYYVDDLDKSQLTDAWSVHIRNGNGGQPTRVVQKPTQKDILEAYDALGNDKKNEIYQEQLKRAEEEAYKKAQAKIKADEQKAKEKAKLKAEAEKKAKEEALKSGASEQMSLFDF